jgi:hypothetical protein
MGLFRDQILRTPVKTDLPTLLDILKRIILDQIQMDRDGEAINPHNIKANVYMLEGLYESEQEVEDEKLYLMSFEQDFLETSAAFYREEGERMLKDSDAGTYCRHAKRRIDEEHDRCRSTLSESTTPKIQRVVEDELIRHKMKGLIEMDSGVQYMVDNDKLQELGLVFDLEARVDPRKPELTAAMQKIIMEMGTNINNSAIAASTAPAVPSADQAGDKSKTASSAAKINQQTVAALKWVEDILALKDRFDGIWAKAFEQDQTLLIALNRTTADIINAFNRGSEYISLYIDENMKKGIRNKTQAEIDQTLEKAILLLRYLQDKDKLLYIEARSNVQGHDPVGGAHQRLQQTRQQPRRRRSQARGSQHQRLDIHDLAIGSIPRGTAKRGDERHRQDASHLPTSGRATEDGFRTLLRREALWPQTHMAVQHGRRRHQGHIPQGRQRGQAQNARHQLQHICHADPATLQRPPRRRNNRT